jgi:hypothetical protein
MIQRKGSLYFASDEKSDQNCSPNQDENSAEGITAKLQHDYATIHTPRRAIPSTQA